MNYSDLTAKELQALCEEHGLRPRRAKADMIAALEALDADLTAEPETEVPSPESEAETVSEAPAWRHEDGFYHTFPKGPDRLEDREHFDYIRQTERAAEEAGYHVRGGGFRIPNDHTTLWFYKVWVQ